MSNTTDQKLYGLPEEIIVEMRKFLADRLDEARLHAPPSEGSMFCGKQMDIDESWMLRSAVVHDERHFLSKPYVQVDACLGLQPKGFLSQVVEYRPEDLIRIKRERLVELRKRRDEIDQACQKLEAELEDV